MEPLLNYHTRSLKAPPEAVRGWLEKAWSAGPEDIFPRDYIPNWRRNPEGIPAERLVPGVTQLGHGPFRFLLTEWDGQRWRVQLVQGNGLSPVRPGGRAVTVSGNGLSPVRPGGRAVTVSESGWHGFDLEACEGGSRITHTLCLTGSPLLLLLARWFLLPVHDWAVEALLDRLETALETGRVPALTTRPQPWRARLAWKLFNWRRVRNVHSRLLDWPVEQVRPWLEWVWSGTDRDVFPRDRIATYRRNPDALDPLELVPGVTRLGHGPARFLFETWNSDGWRARFLLRRIRGHQSFFVEREGAGSRLTHVVDVRLYGRALLDWPILWRPMHDWAIEALFDRLQIALATGQVPARTMRPLPLVASCLPPGTLVREPHDHRSNGVAKDA